MRVSFVLIIACVALLVLPAPRFSGANGVTRNLLNETDRALLARDFADSRRSARFIIAYDPASSSEIVSKLASDGARIEKLLPEIGYVRAEVAINRLNAIMQDPNVQAIDYFTQNVSDFELQGMQPRLPSGREIPPRELPTPNAKTPAVNPFTGLRDMNIPQFLAHHPTYDGRGTVIGFLEAADPLAPGLQKARALDGQGIPKFAAYRVAEGPFDREQGGGYHNMRLGWVDMHTVVYARNGRFTYRGISYHVPYDGVFRFAWFTTSRGQYLLWQHFKNTNHSKGRRVTSATSFPVLWDVSRGKVWVNAHQNGDFAQEPAIGDFHGLRRDIGVLPLTFLEWQKVDARLPGGGEASNETHFIVETDPTDHFVRFEYVGLDDHASMVAGSAAGNGFFGGAFNGVAPGTQISVVDGYSPFLIEALDALAKSKVDVISSSWLFTPYRSADGVTSRVIDRIIRVYNVSIVSSAGNEGPAAQSVDLPSTANDVISAGGYVSAETARYDEGVVFPDPYGVLAMYSSRGPSNDGAMKPDILAQTEWLTDSTSEAPSGLFRQEFLLPKGYELGGGTSQAAPTAAGAIALLISAAKQTGLSYNAELIKRALTSSGKSVPYQRFEIGGGLIDIPAAWSALQRLAANPPPHIEVRAPVRTVTSAQFAEPNVGRGLYEREGWYAGMRGVRTIVYTLAPNASANSYTYVVRVIGDSVTFTTSNTITLLRGESVSLPVRIAPPTSGIHSAIVELVDQRSQTVVDQRLCTVIAAERFSAYNDYTIVHEGSVSHPGYRRYFFAVPRGTTSFSVNAAVRRSGLASVFDTFAGGAFIAITMPDGLPPPITWRYRPIADGLHWAQAIDDPMPGVWEIDVQNVEPGLYGAMPNRVSPVPPTPYQLRVAVYKVIARSAPQKFNSQVILVNRMAPLRVESASVTLARVRNVVMRISPDRERSAAAFVVPANVSQVFVRFVHRLSGADISLYLFNCANNAAAEHSHFFDQGMCVLAGSANSRSGDGLATTANPRSLPSAIYTSEIVPAGRWVAVIDGIGLAGPIPVNLEVGTVQRSSLHEVLLHAREFRTGESWTQRFPLPSPTGSRNSIVALLELHAANVMTIWEKSDDFMIPTTIKSKPQIAHRLEAVWSAIVPLEHL